MAKKSKKKKIARIAWSKSDVRQLKILAKQKAGVLKIARTLKRTPGAITAMGHKLGVSLSTRG